MEPEWEQRCRQYDGEALDQGKTGNDGALGVHDRARWRRQLLRERKRVRWKNEAWMDCSETRQRETCYSETEPRLALLRQGTDTLRPRLAFLRQSPDTVRLPVALLRQSLDASRQKIAHLRPRQRLALLRQTPDAWRLGLDADKGDGADYSTRPCMTRQKCLH
jgi:hypothetical protein